MMLWARYFRAFHRRGVCVCSLPLFRAKPNLKEAAAAPRRVTWRLGDDDALDTVSSSYALGCWRWGTRFSLSRLRTLISPERICATVSLGNEYSDSILGSAAMLLLLMLCGALRSPGVMPLLPFGFSDDDYYYCAVWAGGFLNGNFMCDSNCNFWMNLFLLLLS